MYDVVATLAPSSSSFDWIFFIIAGNKDNHKISDKFEIRPDPTTDCKSSYLSLALGVSKNPHRLLMGEMLWPL